MDCSHCDLFCVMHDAEMKNAALSTGQIQCAHPCLRVLFHIAHSYSTANGVSGSSWHKLWRSSMSCTRTSSSTGPFHDQASPGVQRALKSFTRSRSNMHDECWTSLWWSLTTLLHFLWNSVYWHFRKATSVTRLVATLKQADYQKRKKNIAKASEQK